MLQIDGDPLEACSVAAQAALACTVIPATQPIPGESGLLEDFEVVGDLSLGSSVRADDVPLCIAISKVSHVKMSLCYF